MITRVLCLCAAIMFCQAARSPAQTPQDESTADPSSSLLTQLGDELIASYFEAETNRLTQLCLAQVHSLEDWTSRRDEYRQQLLEMLGLDPMPDRTPLEPVVTGTLEQDEIIVEMIQFQSLPGLYVTANLYRPRVQDVPLPAILYVCGHGGVKKGGVSLGNKTHYQHHGAWFARHGYVCLIIDTIQLGEIEGIHHGTYRENMWWWNSRGYTPAGVEAWNSIRSLDYLQSRPEVDPDRMGITGRSGGGAYSWWTAAIDDRVKVAVPVAGITSLKNHVVDGCVEGHCDCMYMVNTYQWDYPMVAALVAPRPLLISNSDKDRIFPLDGVVDVHAKVRRIYELYGEGDKLGLQITEGPHKDTQELRVHAFRWFNRFLKGEDQLLSSPATPYFDQEQLKVLDTIPANERVTTIHESFVPAVSIETLPRSREQLNELGPRWIQLLRDKTFRGWPQPVNAPAVRRIKEVREQGLRLRVIEFDSQDPFRLQLLVLSRIVAESAGMTVRPLAQSDWEAVASALAIPFPAEFQQAESSVELWSKMETELSSGPIAFVLPRGVGPTQWSADEKTHTHIRRRFMQVGQTLAGMQTYDLVRALQALDSASVLRPEVVKLSAQGEAATWALYASLFADNVDHLILSDLPVTNKQSPDLLNVSRIVEVPHLAMLAAARTRPLIMSFSQSDSDSQQSWQDILETNPLARELIELVTQHGGE